MSNGYFFKQKVVFQKACFNRVNSTAFYESAIKKDSIFTC